MCQSNVVSNAVIAVPFVDMRMWTSQRHSIKRGTVNEHGWSPWAKTFCFHARHMQASHAWWEQLLRRWKVAKHVLDKIGSGKHFQKRIFLTLVVVETLLVIAALPSCRVKKTAELDRLFPSALFRLCLLLMRFLGCVSPRVCTQKALKGGWTYFYWPEIRVFSQNWQKAFEGVRFTQMGFSKRGRLSRKFCLFICKSHIRSWLCLARHHLHHDLETNKVSHLIMRHPFLADSKAPKLSAACKAKGLTDSCRSTTSCRKRKVKKSSSCRQVWWMLSCLKWANLSERYRGSELFNRSVGRNCGEEGETAF